MTCIKCVVKVVPIFVVSGLFLATLHSQSTSQAPLRGQVAPSTGTVQTPNQNSTSGKPVLTPEERAALQKARQDQLRNDWANLARYREANAKISAPVKVVFMGDSITELWQQDPAGFLQSEGYIGRGIGGQTTPQMLVRFQQDVVHLKPQVVVINGGTNDIAGNTGPSTLEMIEDNLKAMTEIAEANRIKVVLTTVTPAFEYPWKPGLQPAEKVVALNSWIKDFCRSNGCIYADYFTPMANERHGMKEGLSKDGIHPTTAGYSVMAPIALKAISEALSSVR